MRMSRPLLPLSGILLAVGIFLVIGPIEKAHGEVKTQPKIPQTEVAILESTAPDNTPNLKGGDLVTLPQILTPQDAQRYTRIFTLQKTGNWKAAEKEIKSLSNRILMGHVLAQKYLHPTKYRSKYVELKKWLDEYADHPQAKRLYRLALKRRPQNYKYPVKPVSGYLSGSGTDPGAHIQYPYVSPKKRSKSVRNKVTALNRKVRRYIRQGSPTKAKQYLASNAAAKYLDTTEIDLLKARIAAGYFSAGKDMKALEMAEAAAKRSGKKAPRAHWTAGLAAWRQGMLKRAANHFETLALSDSASGWNVAAAAYWAARAHLLNREPAKVSHWLNLAALHSRTFYGLLARRNLGLPTFYNWGTPGLTHDLANRILAVPGGRRAIALSQISRSLDAEKELRKVYPGADTQLASAILAVAAKANLPGLSMRIGTAWSQNFGNPNDSALYPVPQWEPEGGFTVDRALVFAVMRQESRFISNAKSPAGARGLMQLMPRTASFITKDKSFRKSGRDRLFDPDINITLGQKYLGQLLNDPNVGGNLFLLAVAYNGGPGNLAKWRRKINFHNDPLLFIEAIPISETRGFIEKVLTNLWIYRQRLGQNAPSLDAIAAGQWPVYKPLEGGKLKVAQNGGN